MDPPPFDRRRLVIEVLENVEITDTILEQLQHLRAEGYQLAMDDFELTEDTFRAASHAHFVKVDIRAMDTEQLTDTVQRLAPLGKRLLAEKVETWEEFETCKALGFELFQGYFFSKPENVTGKRLSPGKLAVLDLLSSLYDPSIKRAELCEVIGRDPQLAVKLLRLINSAQFRRRVAVESLDHAISLLGLDQLRSWASLLALASMEDKPTELTRLALVRARACHNLAKLLHPDDKPEEYFIAALLSLLDAFLDAEIETVLTPLPVADSIRSAVLERQGSIGEILQAVECFERGAWDDLDWLHWAEQGVDEAAVTDAYAEAQQWAEATAPADSGLKKAS